MRLSDRPRLCWPGAHFAWLAILLLSVPAGMPAQQVAIFEHPLLTYSFPYGITAGPDGALWFTVNASKIGRITTAGVVTEYAVPTDFSETYEITAGPDGALWFTESYSNKIGRITTAGVITEYPLPTAGSSPWSITAGPDGALWFTDRADKIGRITTAGVITEYPLPTRGSYPQGITAGPDGALWFTEYSGDKIGRITTAGVITEYPLPTRGSYPEGITAGPDGALWFAEYNKIGRITTAGIITEYPLPTSYYLQGITVGPDGALWFTGYGDPIGKIWRITTAGVITEYPVPSGTATRITAGPDGALWFTERDSDKIGQLVFTTAVLTASPSSGVPGANFTLTGSGFTPSETIHLCVNSTGCGPQHTVTADAGGSFEFSGRVGPRLPYGPHSLVGVGQSSSKLGVAPLFINPRLFLDPSAGTVGGTITAHGAGFGAEEQVKVYWYNPQLLLGTATADSRGMFTDSGALTFTIPVGAPTGINGVFGVGQSTRVLGKSYINVE